MLTQAIESIGYGMTLPPSGLPKNTYYTPDGRVIKALPNIREYSIKQGNTVIEQGTRDANLDRGWLLQPPQVKKLFCRTCDRWHDTQEEVEHCRLEQNRKFELAGISAKAKLAQENINKDVKIDELSKKVEELTRLMERLSGQFK